MLRFFSDAVWKVGKVVSSSEEFGLDVVVCWCNLLISVSGCAVGTIYSSSTLVGGSGGLKVREANLN